MPIVCESTLVVCPVYNERNYIAEFYSRLIDNYNGNILFVNDGSTDRGIDGLRSMLRETERGRVCILCHEMRKGYGAALLTGFRHALKNGYERIITLDADLQHRPEDIPRFMIALDGADVVLGSRYISGFAPSNVPEARWAINRHISALLEQLLFRRRFAGFTDPFCGFRGYRREFLEAAHLEEQSYGISLEILLESVRVGASTTEIWVAPIYLNAQRGFHDGLNDPVKRLRYYKRVIAGKLRELEPEHPWLLNGGSGAIEMEKAGRALMT